MTHTHHALNIQQYQDKSHNYLYSPVHAQGAEFDKIKQLIEAHKLAHILDLGCGGGHVSYQVAPVTTSVIAYDITPTMTEVVASQAKKRGLTNISTQIGTAEKLPFADHQFDAIITRYSAHHWQNVPQALFEMHRVLADDGKVVIVDVLGNSNPVLNNFLQTIETIRDPSHVKDYSLAEWLYFAEITGFCVATVEMQKLSLNFDSWVARMHTADTSIQVIRALQKNCAASVRQYFEIDEAGNFSTDVIYLVLSK